MSRKVLLIEPNYKNKYPPIALMKLSTYHKMLGDNVTFFKGNLLDLIIEQIYGELIKKLNRNDSTVDWSEYKKKIIDYLKKGLSKNLSFLTSLSNDPLVGENLRSYRKYYRKKEYFKDPKWDRICISTLFTFHWKQTIETINFAKNLCKDKSEVWVGGVTASVVPEEVERATGIKPWIGLLDTPKIMDNNDIIIDHLALDYSILEEIEYVYPENNGYYAYMTRGCVNKCPFCVVPIIEPKYCNYISIKEQIQYINEKFGEKRNLLLLDNNVLASERFTEIIDEIKECGFDKRTKFVYPNKYEIAIKGLIEGYNNKGYINSIIKQFKELIKKVNKSEAEKMYSILKKNKLLDNSTATIDKIIETYDYFKPLFEKFYINKPKERYVDFNQGIDARLLTEEKMSKLAEIPIRPLRIAFDSWEYKDIYESAIRVAAKNGIRNMSNYLLYNYRDKPVELYYRMKLNIELCDELDICIYSFPMKYHPIKDPQYFQNRNYIGVNWNRKFIRAIQAVLNATKGKIGRGQSFFNEAFGSDESEFEKLLYMPEALIIYRFFYKNNGVTDKWWEDFNNLNGAQKQEIKAIIHNNDFSNIENTTNDNKILNVLRYYTITRKDTEALNKT